VVVDDGATVDVVVGSVAGAVEAVVAATVVLWVAVVEDVGVTSGTAPSESSSSEPQPATSAVNPMNRTDRLTPAV